MTEPTSDLKVRGLSAFFYFAIPAVLAIAALWWLAFAGELHMLSRTLSQEKRSAVAVGAADLPKEPIKLQIEQRRNSPLSIDRAEIDGRDLWVYYRNVSKSPITYIQLPVRQIAPDGTVVSAYGSYVSVYSENNAPDTLDGGQRGEAHYRINLDPRTVILEIRMSCYECRN